MALATRFLDLLDEALERRTEVLRRLVVRGALGAPKKFSRRIRDQLMRRLLDAASKVLVRQHAKKKLVKVVVRRRLRHIVGFGIEDRFDRLFRWAQDKLYGPIIYAFWNGRRCLYVGKGRSYRRLRAYAKSIYLKDADALEVWQVKTKGRLPSAECLAIHLFRPRDNKNKPAKVKWGKACPVCKLHDEISEEITSLLKLKG
jgi:ribosomal protein L33